MRYVTGFLLCAKIAVVLWMLLCSAAKSSDIDGFILIQADGWDDDQIVKIGAPIYRPWGEVTFRYVFQHPDIDYLYHSQWQTKKLAESKVHRFHFTELQKKELLKKEQIFR